LEIVFGKQKQAPGIIKEWGQKNSGPPALKIEKQGLCGAYWRIAVTDH